jgi:hypothetical protein
MAAWSSSLENKKAGSNGTVGAPPGRWRAGASAAGALPSRNQLGSRWNKDDSKPSRSSDGTRLPLSIMLR